MELSKIRIRTGARSKATSPEEIFKSLTLRGTVENTYSPQAEALRLWDSRRSERDNIIEMAIGGGKTLVGLLIAKSIVHETRRKVLYVCPNNQLVEQTAERAGECGIDVATYYSQRWTAREVYDEAAGACVTNYAAVFNGFSTFRGHEIAALVLDDAHVASHEVRKAFTLKVRRSHAAFRPLADVFRAHFARSSKTQQFENALAGDSRTILFVPMFEMARAHEYVRRILVDHGVQTDDNRYAWEHVGGRLSRCVMLVSGAGIEISPPVLPIDGLPYFRSDVRHIYLTATLPSHVEFLRTFGASGIAPIVPTGKLGTAQRQIQFLPGDTDEAQREYAKRLVEDFKTCIITPSGADAEAWCPPGRRFDGRQGHAAIKTFTEGTNPDKLVLAGRYDGVDLPDRACKVLVLDGLPRGESLFDRFIDQGLRIERLRTAHTATRITQAMGRIFRNNRDHGAVLLCGVELQRWLRDPANQQYLPPLLQQQLQLGLELRRHVDERSLEFGALLEKVLEGHKDWDQLYAANVEDFETGGAPPEPAWLLDFTVRERRAFWRLWNDDYPSAAAEYSELARDADERERRLGAWYHHWAGLARQLARNPIAAVESFVRAANERGELGRPETKNDAISFSGGFTPGSQATAIATLLEKEKGLRTRLGQIAATLVNEPDTVGVEQALCDLGRLLGLEASRPDREHHTGPDVLWRHLSSKSGAALEAKTNKQATSQYKKKEDIGQFHDHVEWLKSRHPGEKFELLLVGLPLEVSRDANPPPSLRVVGVEEFAKLAARLRTTLEFVENTGGAVQLAVRVEQALRYHGLLWPACAEGLESQLAIDLRAAAPGLADEGD